MLLLRYLAAIVACVVCAQEVQAGPLPDPVRDDTFALINPQEAALGQLLFYDPILSGNRNIACATCHHPDFATGDGVSLGIGEGGIGLGLERRSDPLNVPPQRIARNAPGLFNLGAPEFSVMFHDGRVERAEGEPFGIRTPMGGDMLGGVRSVLAAQVMFPVLSANEMSGQDLENDVAKAVRQGLISGPGGAWDILARRVAGLPGYAAQFIDVYDHIAAPDDITFPDIANAVAHFIDVEWRSVASPFDAFLRDPDVGMPAMAETGMDLFYGAAGCSDCHAGSFQTDHGFHAMGAPQLGPGMARAFETHTRDLGRMAVTGNADDAYAFRTPSLRNVMQTGPWGHAGGHSRIERFLRDHQNPAGVAARYSTDSEDRRAARLPPMPVEDWREMDDASARISIAQAALIRQERILDVAQIDALVAFLKTLDDNEALSGRLGVPDAVPSGLPVGGAVAD